MPEQRVTFTSPLQPNSARRWEAAVLAAGDLQGHNLRIEPAVMQATVPLVNSAACFANHPGLFEGRDVAALIGTFDQAYYDPDSHRILAQLQAWDTPAAKWATGLIDQLVAASDDGATAPDIGLSLDCWITTGQPDPTGTAEITAINQIEAIDLVFQPASPGARFVRILAERGEALAQRPQGHECPKEEPPMPDPEPNVILEQARSLLVDAKLAAAGLPQPMHAGIRRHALAGADTVATADAEIADAKTMLATLAQPGVIRGFGKPIDTAGVYSGDMVDPLDVARNAVHWLFGVKAATLPPPELRTPSNLYHALTGDHDWRGRFSAEHARFARASTSTLADMATDAMNIIIAEQWEALAGYRWFEPLVTVAPHDGSLNNMNWISFGGISNLPVVSEGATYTELTVSDAKETDSFVKYGGYVGITDEMFRKNQMLKIQAIPRALAAAAVRTRSYYISYIFSQASGLGPTLDDDSTALFDAGHSNYATTAFSIAGWAAARTELFEQTQLGSSKPLGIFPKYLLVPIELYDSALVVFGYGQGMGGYPGTPNNDVNPYAETRPGDPRPTVICVPEWIDATNWYYLADPNVQPVIFMSYAQQPGGGTHPLPELFTVSDPTGGLIFTNDVLPIKVRDWFAYGVAGYRGIGGRVVAA
jgi:hypothetical protein